MIVKSRLEEVMPSSRRDESWTREMIEVVSEFRKGVEEFSDDEIEDIVDEAVNTVRAQDTRKEKAVGA